MKLVAHSDGSCSIKRGVASAAAVLYLPDGEELSTRTAFLRATTTPVAEYAGLDLALTIARVHAGLRLKHTELLVLMDAELVVHQVNGAYRCKRPYLRVWRDLIRLKASAFGSCEIRLFPKAGPQKKRRWGNARADALAGQASIEGYEALSELERDELLVLMDERNAEYERQRKASKGPATVPKGTPQPRSTRPSRPAPWPAMFPSGYQDPEGFDAAVRAAVGGS